MENKNSLFEKNIVRLEEIVALMEKGDSSLEASLALFREGTELMQQCTKELNEAEQLVTKLIADSEGTLLEIPFDQGE